jgi:two-component system, sensor histidine kinase
LQGTLPTPSIEAPVEPAVILIVDDDPRNLLAARAALGEEHELVLASSGQEALRLLLRRDFAVILLDIMMPDLDGFETASLIRSRERTRDTPIIFVTAHRHDDEKVREGYALGAVDFLFKPVVPEVLAAKVAVFVALQERTRRLQLLERHAHEQRLVEAQRRWEADALRGENARKDEFLAVLAHELRNPLTPIVMSLRLLRDRQPDPETVQCVGAMDRQVRHLTRLVDDLLDISRITSGKIALQPVLTDLATVLEQALEATASLTGQHRLVVESGGPLPLVADVDRLAQVVSNLLSNAARYTPSGREIRVAYGERDGRAWIEVCDEGQGISREALPDVFRKYYQEDRGGSVGLGLGLAIARHLVELHGGQITASSPGAGRGSTFRFEVPIDHLEAQDGPLPSEISLASRSVVHSILVVDDNDDVRSMVADFLRENGHEVCEAGDGESAVEVATERPPDVVLLDLGMPVLDGHETARLLWERLGDRTPPLVALTGYGAASDRARTAERFAAHLVKPVDPDQLLQTLEDVLAQRSVAALDETCGGGPPDEATERG